MWNVTTAGATVKPSLGPRAFRRILLIKPSSLGDVVHALPVLHALRRGYPQAHLGWLVGRSCAGLLEGHPDLNELIVFDRRRFGRLGRNWSAGVEFARFLRSLRARGYELAIDLQGLFRSGFLTLACGAQVRLGFVNAREVSWIFYTHRMTVPPDVQHAAERNYAAAQVLGLGDVPMTFNLALRESERLRAQDMLERAGVSAEERFAAVLPGARWETKRWFPERFAEIIDRLATEHGMWSVLLGAPEEHAIGVTVLDGCRSRPVNLVGRTGLREMAAILDRAAVVLCHDSAPMHLAAALRKPLVCLLGPTNPARTGPYAADAAILQADLPCAPCHLRKLSQCRFDHRCMHEVSVEQVSRAVAAALELGRPPG